MRGGPPLNAPSWRDCGRVFDGLRAVRTASISTPRPHLVSMTSCCRSSRACSERSYEILTESLQTLGGSGYLQD
jgi:hypothetical protein